MEQFLRNFFNNDSVCLGLCDLQRKIAGVSFDNPPAHMQQTRVQAPQPQVYHQAYAQSYVQQQVQPQQPAQQQVKEPTPAPSYQPPVANQTDKSAVVTKQMNV